MKVLVTGATGFIGSALVRELLKDGLEVRVLVREGSSTKNIDGLDVEKVYGDIRDREYVKTALKGCNTFYQTAALFTHWAPDNKIFYDVNVEGTKTALNAALEQGIEKVVYTSSIAAVGCPEDGKLANEETEFNTWKTGSHYILSKYMGEVEARKICRQGLPLVIVNPANVVGVRDTKPTPSGENIVNILKSKWPGYIEGGGNFVDVEDVARGHILAAQKGRIGERYILGNQNMTIKDFFQLVADVAGVEPPKRKIPYPIALIMAYLSQIVSGITRKPPAVSMYIAKSTGCYFYYDSSKAVSELGLPQTPIRTTVEKAIDWFRENGYIGDIK